uniref:Retrotransposon gag domain-containing protein n=1 Tax=Brassica oleracea var. oleracea TaxID=109376 RepID=A0A0D3BVB7_BRAOL
MAVDDQDNTSESTPREAELQRQLDGLQSHVTELRKDREATEDPDLSSEVQSLKEKLDEHSKQLEQSAEKLTQLESENLVLRDKNQALNTTSNKKCCFRTQVRSMPSLDTPNTAGSTARQPLDEAGASGEKAGDTQVHETISSNFEPDAEKETSEGAAALQSSLTTNLDQMFSKKLDAMQSMVERLPGVAPLIWKSSLGSYADTPFTENIALIKMARKFSFPNIKVYDGTGDPDDHIAQYKQRMLAVALPREFHKATMCKGFGSTLIGPTLHWYINLPIGSISSFAALSDKFVEQFASSRSLEKTSDSLYKILQHRVEPLRDYIARLNQEKVSIPEFNITTEISAFKRGLLLDEDLYKELTKYQCKTMEDVLSRAWAQVKWEEDVASRAKA